MKLPMVKILSNLQGNYPKEGWTTSNTVYHFNNEEQITNE